MCKNTDTCTHINHLGTRLYAQLRGKTGEMCVCICVRWQYVMCVYSQANVPPRNTLPATSATTLSSIPTRFLPSIFLYALREWSHNAAFTATPPHASIFYLTSPGLPFIFSKNCIFFLKSHWGRQEESRTLCRQDFNFLLFWLRAYGISLKQNISQIVTFHNFFMHAYRGTNSEQASVYVTDIYQKTYMWSKVHTRTVKQERNYNCPGNHCRQEQ